MAEDIWHRSVQHRGLLIVCIVDRDINGMYTLSTGRGLFTSMTIPCDTIIAIFVGDLISKAEAEVRTERGDGGYIVYIKTDMYLDCKVACLM